MPDDPKPPGAEVRATGTRPRPVSSSTTAQRPVSSSTTTQRSLGSPTTRQRAISSSSTTQRSAAATPASVAPDPGFYDAVNAALARKNLGASFDGLVRSARVQETSALPIARRVLEQWEAIPEAVIRIWPERLQVDDEVCFTVAEQEGQGQWLLPLYMAGLRKLRLLEDVGPGDLLRLADEIAKLEPRFDALEEFRNWMFADGAEGFDLDVQVSFTEVMESAFAASKWEEWGAQSVRSFAAGLSQGARRTAGPEAIAARDRFMTPFLAFQQKARQNGFGLPPDGERALKASCDSAVGWSFAEVGGVFEHTGLLAAMPPDRLARKLQMLLAVPDVRAVQCLAAAARLAGDYGAVMFRELQGQPVGEMLARRVPLEGSTARPVLECLQRLPDGIRGALAHGLLARAADDAAAMTFVGGLVGAMKPIPFCALLKADGLNYAEGRAIARILGASLDGLAVLGELMANGMKAPIQVIALAALPPQLLARMRDRVVQLFRTAAAGELSDLIVALSAGRDSASVALLTEVINLTRCEQWGGREIHVAFKALVEAEVGSTVLVPLVRSRSTDPAVRLAALRAMSNEPVLLALACRWRFSELLDPLPVQKRLRETRARLRPGNKGDAR